MDWKTAFRLTLVPVLAASLCCLSPLVLFLIGLSTASAAASLADTFYGEYRWAFRVVGMVLLGAALAVYWVKRQGVCTLDAVKRRRREILNSLLLTAILGTLGYLFFLYVVVHYLGVWAALWT